MADMEEDGSSSEEDEVFDEHLELELQVEESTSDTESSGIEDVDENEQEQFDPTLPASHLYLGEGMEEISGRTVHTDDEIITIPLLSMQGISLVPGQILPLNLFHPQSVGMMRRVIDSDKTFGLLHASKSASRRGPEIHLQIGTTAEIFSFKEENEYGIATLMMKAEGRQRFKVLEIRRQLDGVLLGKVRILPEIKLPVYPPCALLRSSHVKPSNISAKTSHCQYQISNSKWQLGKRRFGGIKGPHRREIINFSLSSWPVWVYNLYNPFNLMDQLFHEVGSWNPDLKLDYLSTDPSEFSHWMTANLPLDDDLRSELLRMDCPIQRLQKQLDVIRKCSVWCCQVCGNRFAEKNDLFSMAVGGPMGAYVNPGGYVHETVTFHKTVGLRLRGRPSSEHSWFPGYAWTIAECGQCGLHIGWRFSAVKRGLTPSKFWGLSRASLAPTITSVRDDTS